MSDAGLKRWIRTLLTENLAASGFELKKPRILERRLEHLRQGLEFQPGTGHLEGRYTVNVYWSYLISPIQDEHSMHATKRIGSFAAGRDTWYGRDDAEDFAIVKGIIIEKVMPHFQSYDSIAKILAALDQRRLRADDAFPIDAGWREFYLGHCYVIARQMEKARFHLQSVIDQHSDSPQPWAADRKHACVRSLLELQEC